MTSNFNKDVKSADGCAIVVGFVLVMIVAAVGISALVAMLFMWAWGLFMVPVFGLSLLSFQEAFGAIALLLVIRFMLAPTSIKRSVGK
jgi:hypothetical protein